MTTKPNINTVIEEFKQRFTMKAASYNPVLGELFGTSGIIESEDDTLYLRPDALEESLAFLKASFTTLIQSMEVEDREVPDSRLAKSMSLPELNSAMNNIYFNKANSLWRAEKGRVLGEEK